MAGQIECSCEDILPEGKLPGDVMSVQSSCSSNKMSVDESRSVDSVGDERFKWTTGSLFSFQLVLREKVKFNVIPDWRDVFEAFKREFPNATTKIIVAKLMKMQLQDNQLYKLINSTSNQTKILECLVQEETLKNRLVKNAENEKHFIKESSKEFAFKRPRKSLKYIKQHYGSSSHNNMPENTSMPSVNLTKKSKADCIEDAKSFGKMSQVAFFHALRFFKQEDDREVYMRMTDDEKKDLIKEFHSPNPRCFLAWYFL